MVSLSSLFGKFLVYFATPVHAAVSGSSAIVPVGSPGIGSGNITTTILHLGNTVIDILSLIAGIAAVGYLIWNGIQYIVSAGSAEKAKSARAGIVNAVIGIIIIAATFGLIKLAIGIGNGLATGNITVGSGTGSGSTGGGTAYNEPTGGPPSQPSCNSLAGTIEYDALGCLDGSDYGNGNSSPTSSAAQCGTAYTNCVSGTAGDTAQASACEYFTSNCDSSGTSGDVCAAYNEGCYLAEQNANNTAGNSSLSDAGATQCYLHSACVLGNGCSNGATPTEDAYGYYTCTGGSGGSSSGGTIANCDPNSTVTSATTVCKCPDGSVIYGNYSDCPTQSNNQNSSPSGNTGSKDNTGGTGNTGSNGGSAGSASGSGSGAGDNSNPTIGGIGASAGGNLSGNDSSGSPGSSNNSGSSGNDNGGSTDVKVSIAKYPHLRDFCGTKTVYDGDIYANCGIDGLAYQRLLDLCGPGRTDGKPPKNSCEAYRIDVPLPKTDASAGSNAVVCPAGQMPSSDSSLCKTMNATPGIGVSGTVQTDTNGTEIILQPDTSNPGLYKS